MAEQYIFDVRRAAVQPTLSNPRLPSPSTPSGTLGTQLAYFMLLWIGHPGDSLVVVDERGGNEDLEVALQARSSNACLRFIRAVFHEFREALGGRFIGSEVFRTEDAELLVDVIEVTLKEDDVIPLRTAFCHLDQFYEIIDIKRLTGNRFQVTKKCRQHGDKEPNGNLAGMITVRAESHADVVDTVNGWIQEQIHPYIGYRQQGYPTKTPLQGVATTGPDAVTIVSDRWRVRDGVSVIFASGTASGMEALRIAVGGSVSAVSVETEVVSRYHRYKDNHRKSRVVPRLSIVTGGLACHAPATHASAPAPSSSPSHWSFGPEDDGELDVGESDVGELDEEAQAGDQRYIREDTPADVPRYVREDTPADVPLPEMQGFQYIRLPDGRIAWLAPPRPWAPPRPRSPAADPPPPPPPPAGTPPPPPPADTPPPPPPGPRWRTARAAPDEDDTTVLSL